MLRINLLPAYIAEQRKTRIAWVGTGIGVAAVVGGLLGYHFGYLVPQVSDMTTKANDADAAAKQVEGLEDQAKNTLALIQPLQAKVTFVKGVQYFNLLVPQVYRNVARYTYRRVEYSSMNATGDTLTINAMVQDLSDVGRFYLTLFANPDIAALSIRGMPGWPNATSQSTPLPGQGQPNPNQSRFPLAVTARLSQAITPPAYAGAGAPAGGGGMMGAGMPGMGGSGGPMMGGMMGPGGGGSAPTGPGSGSMGGSGGPQSVE